MKAIVIGWVGCALASVHLLASNTDAVNEVLKLQKAGLSEEVIVSFIRSQNVNYALTSDDLVFLKDLGLSSAELGAMLEVSGNSMGSASAATVPPPGGPLPPSDSAMPSPGPGLAPAVMTEAGPSTVIASPAESPQSAYFYQELNPYGRWILGEDNEWYWQPTVVVGNAEWRPYWDNGHWIYTDAGWYWGSDYPWGWAAFHYGRWQLHPRHGWIWYPGREWGPAWVTWRSGGSYCGWAPLPPHSHFDGVSGRYFYRGRAVEASFDFGLSFGHFNFCYTRQLGDRSRSRFHNEREVRNIYNQTTIINNYTVNRDGMNHEARIVNHGIEPNRIVAQGGRPVDRVQIQDRQSPHNGRSPESVDLKSKTLTVYRPAIAAERPATGAPGAPGAGRAVPESRRPVVTQSPSNSPRPGSPAVGRTGAATERDSIRPAASPGSTPGRVVPAPVSPTPSPARPAVRNPNQTFAPSTPANPGANPPARIQERPAPAGSVPAAVSPTPSPARPAVRNPNQTFAPLTPANPGSTPPARIQERPVAAPRQTITPPARAPARAVLTAPSRSQAAPTPPSRSGARDDRGQPEQDRRNK